MSIEKKAQYYEEISVSDEDDVSYSDEGLYNDDSYEIVVDDESYDDDYYADDEKKKKSDDSDKESSDKDSDDSEKKSDKDDEIVVLEFDNVDPISFVMPSIPGAMDDSEIVVPEIEVEEEKEEPKEVDVWDWQHGGHANFIPWAQGIVNMTPQHSGHDVSGLERAMAWISRLLKEFPKAMSTDFKGEIDVNHCEGLRDGLYDAVSKMQDRKDRIEALKGRKKRADSEFGIVKEAQKSTKITGTSLVVPLFISGIARTLINGMVSGGHSMEDMYDELRKKYSFTDREEFEIQLLLSDMGYAMYQDRGRIGEQVDKSKSDNFDWAAQYQA